MDNTMAADLENPAEEAPTAKKGWRLFGRSGRGHQAPAEEFEEDKGHPTKWSMGVLNDPKTHEVPGSVLLLTGHRNEPLGLRNAPARTSTSSLPSPYPTPSISSRHSHSKAAKKTTADGAIILEPQPDDSHNDPLNWPSWRRDCALLSLGFYCMVGGGMTPILAAGFTNVANTYDVTVPQVALTTGLYMMGLGVGSVLASPTAILFGKRPVYLFSSILFIATSCWCALSPSYASLVVARVLQGMSVSPIECLPSATIAEIFFLHERAYRIGIYSLLLLGGKNLVPLVSAAVIQTLEWRWVFWIVAMIVGFCWVLLFLFVPETFWDRTPRAKTRRNTRAFSYSNFFSSRKPSRSGPAATADSATDEKELRKIATSNSATVASGAIRPGLARAQKSSHRVEFAPGGENSASGEVDLPNGNDQALPEHDLNQQVTSTSQESEIQNDPLRDTLQAHIPSLRNFNSPFYAGIENSNSDYMARGRISHESQVDGVTSWPRNDANGNVRPYTAELQEAPPRSFLQQLKPWEGRLHEDKWIRVASRPFLLFAYPAVLWSAIVYSCSVGWLIVLSESVAVVYRDKATYNFSALSTGLVYLSPFIGGILGTVVAGKVSDIIVRAMSRRNGGLYEPEFRLVMAAPVAVTTVIGLMGFGWSAEVRDSWIVPTLFFGIISFGCSLGATTSITFCVDSYRQYAGEALVTLNFSKNIFHGLVFSLFVNTWLEEDGLKKVFLALGGIQLTLLCFTIPMYIYGKRARMWTVRKNLMEKF